MVKSARSRGQSTTNNNNNEAAAAETPTPDLGEYRKVDLHDQSDKVSATERGQEIGEKCKVRREPPDQCDYRKVTITDIGPVLEADIQTAARQIFNRRKESET